MGTIVSVSSKMQNRRNEVQGNDNCKACIQFTAIAYFFAWYLHLYDLVVVGTLIATLIYGRMRTSGTPYYELEGNDVKDGAYSLWYNGYHVEKFSSKLGQGSLSFGLNSLAVSVAKIEFASDSLWHEWEWYKIIVWDSDGSCRSSEYVDTDVTTQYEPNINSFSSLSSTPWGPERQLTSIQTDGPSCSLPLPDGSLVDITSISDAAGESVSSAATMLITALCLAILLLLLYPVTYRETEGDYSDGSAMYKLVHMIWFRICPDAKTPERIQKMKNFTRKTWQLGIVFNALGWVTIIILASRAYDTIIEHAENVKAFYFADPYFTTDANDDLSRTRIYEVDVRETPQKEDLINCVIVFAYLAAFMHVLYALFFVVAPITIEYGWTRGFGSWFKLASATDAWNKITAEPNYEELLEVAKEWHGDEETAKLEDVRNQLRLFCESAKWRELISKYPGLRVEQMKLENIRCTKDAQERLHSAGVHFLNAQEAYYAYIQEKIEKPYRGFFADRTLTCHLNDCITEINHVRIAKTSLDEEFRRQKDDMDAFVAGKDLTIPDEYTKMLASAKLSSKIPPPPTASGGADGASSDQLPMQMEIKEGSSGTLPPRGAVIITAKYGTTGYGKDGTQKDVRRYIVPCLGESFTVDNRSMHGDPVPGYPKELTITYTLHSHDLPSYAPHDDESWSEEKTLQGLENMDLVLPPTDVHVLSAMYGDLNKGKTLDVTDIVSAALGTTVKVTNTFCGGNPSVGTRKTLKVVYKEHKFLYGLHE